MKPSEIREEDEESMNLVSKSAQRNQIRRIIDYQKSLYYSSSSSASSASSSSCKSFSTHKRISLLDKMKEGSTSLSRLFDMEHTSLSKHFNEYSGSPATKPIYLWGSDDDEAPHGLSPWSHITKFQSTVGNVDTDLSLPRAVSFIETRNYRRRLMVRTKSYRKLPEFRMWRWRGVKLQIKSISIINKY